MSSPFPGMDPFIEECGLFEDFHDSLISQIKDSLATSLPDRYVVRTAERPYVVISQTDGKEEHVFKPDVSVTTESSALAANNGGVAVAEPEVDVDSIPMRAFISTEYHEISRATAGTKVRRA